MVASLKAFHEHAFPIHVGEAKRSMDGGHADFPSPGFDSPEQRGGDLRIVHEIQPAETHVTLAPFFDMRMVEDGSHTSNDRPIPVSQPVARLTGFKGRVPVPAQGVQIVRDQGSEPKTGYPGRVERGNE